MSDIVSGWPPLPPHLEADVCKAFQCPGVQLVLCVLDLGGGHFAPALLLPDRRTIRLPSDTAPREISARCGISEVEALHALLRGIAASICTLLEAREQSAALLPLGKVHDDMEN